MFDFGLSLKCFISLVFSLNNLWPALEKGRTARAQAGYQVAGLAVALGIAILGGIVTGKEQFLFLLIFTLMHAVENKSQTVFTKILKKINTR